MASTVIPPQPGGRLIHKKSTLTATTHVAGPTATTTK
jgi:hypothetical protein